MDHVTFGNVPSSFDVLTTVFSGGKTNNLTSYSTEPLKDSAEAVINKVGEPFSKIASKALDIASTMPLFNNNTSVIGIPGNEATLRQFPNIVVSVQRFEGKESPESVAGRPCYKNVKINTLSGFVKCANASLDIAGFKGDKDAVNSFLNSGFYYE